MPTTGDVNVLTLLISFADYPATFSQEHIQGAILGEENTASPYYPYESLRGFYQRSSYQQLHISGAVLGWYVTDYPRADVAPDNAPNWTNFRNKREQLIQEVLTHYDEQGHDFSQYDNNGDGVIDYFVVIWTGPVGEWAAFWWGYQTSYADQTYVVDGKTLGLYSWQWENRYPGQTTAFVPQVVIHETGHALGLPDYYDYDDTRGPGGGVGLLDQMDSSYFDHNCFSKFLLDWITPTVVTEGRQNLELRPSGAYPDAVLVRPAAAKNDTFGEYFMIQYRDRSYNDDRLDYLLNDGLLVWHVDSTLNPAGTQFFFDNSYTDHKLLRLMEADGLEEIEGGAMFDWADYYLRGDRWGADTLPDSRYYNGEPSGIVLDQISTAGETIRFRLGVNSHELVGAHVAVDDFWWTRVHLVNPNVAQVAGTIQLVGADGGVFAEIPLLLDGRQSLSAAVDELFPGFPTGADMWLRITGDGALAGMLEFGTTDLETQVTIPLMPAGSHRLLFPYVVATADYYTGLTLVNAGDAGVQATLEAYSENGDFLASAPVDLPAGTKYVRLVEGIFPGVNAEAIRFVTLAADGPLFGFELFGSYVDQGLAGLPVFVDGARLAQAVRNGDYRLIYPEIPQNDTFFTGFTVANLTQDTGRVALRLMDAGGNTLAAAERDLVARQQLTREVWAPFGGDAVPEAAYLVVESATPVLGFELFLSRDFPFGFDGFSGTLRGKGAQHPAPNLFFPLVQSPADWSMALRLTNTAGADAALTVIAYDAAGAEVGRHEATITAGGQIYHMLDELFPAPANPVAWLKVESDRAVVGQLAYLSADLTRLSGYLGLTGR
jgi:M6 family metalloprotease-like protein